MFASLFSATTRCGMFPARNLARMARPAMQVKSALRTPPRRSLTTEAIRFQAQKPTMFWGLALGAAGAGLGLGTLMSVRKHRLQCEPIATLDSSNPYHPFEDPLPPPPQSSISLYELSFGTVAGICAGVFIKKGAKAAAFLCGGIFVLLQYFVSFKVVKIDWGSMAKRFEHAFYTEDKTGTRRSPTVYSFFRWLVNFLTADFQPRASFVAGLALGLRIG